MAYTYDEALNEWKKCKTLADFENLISNTSAQITGANANSTYLLYSGESDDKYLSDVSKNIANKSSVFRIQDTPVGKLLSNLDFQKAYFYARWDEYDATIPGFADLSKKQKGEILSKDHNLAWGGQRDQLVRLKEFQMTPSGIKPQNATLTKLPVVSVFSPPTLQNLVFSIKLNFLLFSKIQTGIASSLNAIFIKIMAV